MGAKGTEQQNHCHFPILLGFFQGGGRAQRFKYKKNEGGKWKGFCTPQSGVAAGELGLED